MGQKKRYYERGISGMKEWKGFIAGLLAAGIVAGTVGTAGAVVGRTQANLDYSDIKISVNGEKITPTDANGNYVEPFAINGTTYLPVRAVGNALGLDVVWDAESNTVLMTSRKESDQEVYPEKEGEGQTGGNSSVPEEGVDEVTNEEQNGETENSGVSSDSQYLSERAALDSAHQAEMERLQKALDDAEKNLATAGYGMPDGAQKDLAINVAQQNYNAAKKAIENAENEYQKKLEELNSKYGI